MPTSPEVELTTAEILWSPGFWWVWAAMAFIAGLIFGSFFNVCIYRIPIGLSPNKPKRSFCYRCGTKIRGYDNIPVLSYFLLGGRCRECGAPFSIRYAMVELLTGVVFLTVFGAFNPQGSAAFEWGTFWYIAFSGLLIVGTFTDLDHWIIPDGITLWGAVAAVAAAAVIGTVDSMPLLAEMGPFPVLRKFWDKGALEYVLPVLQGATESGIDPGYLQWWEPLLNSVIGALWGMAMLWSIMVMGKVLFRKDAMGMGDVKLFALIGATLGWLGATFALMVACMVGAAVGIVQIMLSRAKSPGNSVLEDAALLLTPSGKEGKEEEDPFREQLADACRKHSHPSSVHHLPFGPWIAVGAFVVLIFHDWIQRMLFAQ